MAKLKREVKIEAGFKKAVGYVRVSTEEQAKDGHYGINAQKKAINDWATSNRYVIVEWVVDEMSGTKQKRPGFDRLLYGDVADDVKAVICFKSDRIARDTKLYFYYLFLLEKRELTLISTVEDFATEGELANVYRALMLFVAEQERKNINTRTFLGKRVKQEDGGWIGGKVPFGYKNVEKELIVDEYESWVVKYVFYRTERGANPNMICNELNNRAFTTRKGTPFMYRSITSILKNKRLYQGYVKTMDGKEVLGRHEPILKFVKRDDTLVDAMSVIRLDAISAKRDHADSTINVSKQEHDTSVKVKNAELELFNAELKNEV